MRRGLVNKYALSIDGAVDFPVDFPIFIRLRRRRYLETESKVLFSPTLRYLATDFHTQRRNNKGWARSDRLPYR